MSAASFELRADKYKIYFHLPRFECPVQQCLRFEETIGNLTTMSTPAYKNYVSPPPHTLYSQDYFTSLTISQLAKLAYPKIAPPSSILFSEISSKIPCSTSAILVSSKEIIPSYSNLLSITATIENQYEKRNVFCMHRLYAHGSEACQTLSLFKGMPSSFIDHGTSNHKPAIAESYLQLYQLSACVHCCLPASFPFDPASVPLSSGSYSNI